MPTLLLPERVVLRERCSMKSNTAIHRAQLYRVPASTELEGRYAEDARVRKRWRWPQIHPRTAKDLLHPMAIYELQCSGIIFRRIEKERPTRGKPRQV